MKNFFKSIGIIAALSLSVLTSNAEACTGIQLKAKDNTYVNGRTLEFGVFVDTSIAVIPRGYQFVG